MAEILKAFAFRPGGRGASYPWNEWFDGKIRRLVHGKDYTIAFSSFRQAIWYAGKRRGFLVHVNNEGGKSVVIQAVPRNGVNGKKRR